MKKILGIITPIIAVIAIVGFMAANTADANAKEKMNSNFVIKESYNFNSTHIMVDTETGVNYIYVSGRDGGGVCPRYNADGTLYISEVE